MFEIAYDAAGRVATFAVNGAVQANFECDVQGQQLVRELTQTGEVIHAVHDPEGNRIAEYGYDPATGGSTLIRQYIWMEGRPKILPVLTGGRSRLQAAIFSF